MKFGVASYSFPCSCGFAKRDGHGVDTPLNAWSLIDLAVKWQLSSVELPLGGMLPDLSEATIDRLRERLAETGLTLVVDTPVINEANLREIIPLAARAGAKVMRGVVSGVLEGARGQIPGGWGAHLAGVEQQLAAIVPLLDEYDLTLALENHQDTTSAELIGLCDRLGPRVGITMDVANPLAVAEGIVEFARAAGPRIHNVHLKEYTVHATPSGYRLVRAALGDGVIPWVDLLQTLNQLAPHALLQIELAALYGRHIRVFEDAWWESFPPTDVRAALPGLSFMHRHALAADVPWETPWERGEPLADVARWEQEQFARSVQFLRGLEA